MIPFNKPYMTGKELFYIAQAHFNGILAGDGPFTRRCQNYLQANSACNKVLLTHSCSAALEMAALLLNLKPGDEVIMPSYTFVSTANAFVLRGATPVFIDIRPDTLNMDETLIEAAITARTRAIVPVHYAGVACELDTIVKIAEKYGLYIVEDAAQGMMSTYKDKPLGSFGNLGAYSFHETKNVISGKGGCLLINLLELEERAETIREKGTNRNQFLHGEVNRYTWQDLGASFSPGEIMAAFLLAQLEEAEEITCNRMKSWEVYHGLFELLEKNEALRRPVIPDMCKHNAHMYYVLLDKSIDRQHVLDALSRNAIVAVSHYEPLHTSPGGRKYGKASGELPVTELAARQLIRLPLWVGISISEQEAIFDVFRDTCTSFRNKKTTLKNSQIKVIS